MTVASFIHEGAPVRIVFGVGARHRLVDELDRLGLSQVVLIASGSSRSEADSLVRQLDHRLTWRIDGVRQGAPAELVEQVTADAIRVGADAVVTIGGGSATGVGKAVALSGLPLLALPTTYAGWEMTPVWGVTTGRGRETGWDLLALPRTVVYDPELTLSLPPPVTAASGMSALAHCLEALWVAGAGPLSAPLALDGARALAETLPAAVTDPLDLVTRCRVLVGACQAGLALASAGAGLHHRICQVLGGRFGLPYAQTHAVVLPHVVAFNETVLGPLAARMAVAVGAGRASAGLHDLVARLGLPMSLAELGLAEEAIPQVAADVMDHPPANPRRVDDSALRSILRAAWQ